MRTLMATFGLLALLACSAGDAIAFEQTAPAPSVPATPPSPGLQGIPSESAPAAPHTSGSPQAPGFNGGESSSVKVPGLGSFNFLPKLDFGLELMYGGPPKAESPIDPLQDQDVTIRGSVKKRF